MASNENGWRSFVMDVESHDFRFSFTIKNFLDYYCNAETRLATAEMECSKSCGAKWTLQVCPFGSYKCVGVFLNLTAKPSYAEIECTSFVIYILGENDAILNRRGPINVLKEDLMKYDRGYINFILRSEIEQKKNLYLPNGHLTIRCEGKEFLRKSYQKQPASNPSPVVLKKIYEERICSDFILKTGSSEFKCHKAILSATSNYFKAMFEHEMIENRENMADLSKDLNAEELRAMLDYIYLKKPEFVHLPQVSVQTLYRVGDMYDIDGFQDACEAALINELNLDNAWELMKFSMEHGAQLLKKKAALIIANSKD